VLVGHGVRRDVILGGFEAAREFEAEAKRRHHSAVAQAEDGFPFLEQLRLMIQSPRRSDQ